MDQRALDIFKKAGITPPSQQGSSMSSVSQQSNTMDQRALDIFKKAGITPPSQSGSSMSSGNSGMTPSDTPSFKPSKFVQSMEDYRPNYVEKGQGSGKDGKRTFGDIYNNINEGIGDFQMGAQKSVLRAVPHLIQGVTPDAMWGKNSLLNSESERANAFRSATTGKTGLQKLGATAIDIGAIVASGGVGAGVTGATEAGLSTTRAASVLSKAGATGKLARIASKVPGAAVDTVLSNAIINKGEVRPGENILGTGASLVLPPALRKAGDLIKRTTQGAEKYTANKFAKALGDIGETAGVPKNAVEEGYLNQARQDVKDYAYELIRTKRQKGLLESGAKRLDFLEPGTEKDVIDTILTKAGGFGEATKKGTIDSTSAIKRITDNTITPLMNKINELVGSSNQVMNAQDHWDAVARSIPANATNTEKNAFAEMVKVLRSESAMLGDNFVQEVSPLKLLEESKALRGKIKYNNFDSQDVINRNNTKRAVMKAYDKILRNGIEDVSGGDIQKAYDEVAKAYDATALLESFNGDNVPSAMGKGSAKVLGAVSGGFLGGGGPGGFLLSGLGSTGSDELNQYFGKSAFKSNSTNEVRIKLADYFADKTSKEISAPFESAITGNKKAKIRTELGKFFDGVRSSELKTIRKDIISRLRDAVEKESISIKNTAERAKFNESRKSGKDAINRFFEERKLGRAKSKYNSMQEMRDYNRIASPFGTQALPAPKGSPTTPLSSVNGKPVIRLTTPSTVKGSSLRDYLK